MNIGDQFKLAIGHPTIFLAIWFKIWTAEAFQHRTKPLFEYKQNVAIQTLCKHSHGKYKNHN